MSDQDENGTLLPFPRVVLPGSMDAGDGIGPRPQASGSAAESNQDDGQGTAGVGRGTMPLPVVPGLPALVPPLHLTVPGTPDPGAETDVDLAAEGALVLPSPEDPANPTAREAVALAMALVTALGVAAAQGMWHRARHRQAVADQARASADRTGPRGGRFGDHGFRLPGPGASPRPGRVGRRAASGDLLGSSLSSAGRSRGRSSMGRHSGWHGGRNGGRGHGHWADHMTDRDGLDRTSRRSRRALKAGKDGAVGSPRKGSGASLERPSTSEAHHRGRRTRPGIWRRARNRLRGRGHSNAPAEPARMARPLYGPALEAGRRGGFRRRVLFWRSRGKGNSQRTREPRARRRWTRGQKADSTPRPQRSARSERSGTRWAWIPWTRTRTWWFKQWRSRRTRNGEQEPAQDTQDGRNGQDPRDSRDSQGGPDRGGWRGWDRRTSGFEPPPGFEWMRPPPGQAPEEWTVERVDVPHRPADRPSDSMPALSAPQPTLTAGTPADASPPPPGPEIPPLVPRQEGPSVNTPAPASTQYGDAELTIGDVIDADADMAAQIVDGVAEARAAADGCERLVSRLEALHAKVVELRVPGVLEGMVLLLMEGAMTVKAKAEAIAEQLPAAAEAIAVAGANAELRHKPLADAVRDAGHTRPAERDYHNE